MLSWLEVYRAVSIQDTCLRKNFPPANLAYPANFTVADHALPEDHSAGPPSYDEHQEPLPSKHVRLREVVVGALIRLRIKTHLHVASGLGFRALGLAFRFLGFRA